MASKRYITVLATISIVNFDDEPMTDGRTGKPAVCTMAQFVNGRTQDGAFPTERNPHDPAQPYWTGPDLDAAARVRTAFRGKGAGDVIELDEDDYAQLRRATDRPAPPGYPDPIVAACLRPFMRAIEDAKREAPAVVAPLAAE